LRWHNLRVAFIGGKGIIQAHLRILNKLGINNFCLLSSSIQSTINNCSNLKQILGIDIMPVKNKNDLIVNFNPDCVFICSSHDSHFKYIEFFLKKSIPIFCEKPFFWEHDIKNFKFIFHTNGQFKFSNIGIDLIPHGLSTLHELFGFYKIKKIQKKIISNKFECFFEYKNVNVTFEFKQGKEILKKLSLHLDESIFDRIQKGQGKSYEVFLEDKKKNTIYKLVDPFETHIIRFLENVHCGNKSHDDFVISCNNMLHMYDIIKG